MSKKEDLRRIRKKMVYEIIAWVVLSIVCVLFTAVAFLRVMSFADSSRYAFMNMVILLFVLIVVTVYVVVETLFNVPFLIYDIRNLEK